MLRRIDVNGRIAAALAVGLGFACQPASDERPGLSFDSYLTAGLDHGFPAMVLAVDVAGVEPWTGAAGVADLGTGRPATMSDAFHLASITKLLTAVATLRLIDRGELTLDTRVADVLSRDVLRGIPFIDRVTVGQLLDHSSGIYGFNNDLTYLATVIGPRAAEGVKWEPRDLVALADGGRVRPFGEPGTGNYYGDTNYILLGMVVAAVAERPFREHLRADLFERLGMTCTEFVSDLRTGDRTLPCLMVEGYAHLTDELLEYWQVPGDIFPLVPGTSLRQTTAAGEALDAAPGVVTTAPDLMRLARAVFRGDLLTPRTREWLTAPARELADEPIGREYLGALWGYRLEIGPVLTAEGDGPGGSNTLLAWHPDREAIVIAFTNIFGLGDELDFLLTKVAAPIFGYAPTGSGQ